MQASIGEAAGVTVTILAIMSMLSLCHANLFQAPRVLLALSRDGWFRSAASSVTRKGALLPGLAISVAGMVILALTGTFEELFISIALLSFAADALVYTAVLRLRRTEPDLPRPYRAKGYPWLPLLVVLYAFGVLLAAASAVLQQRCEECWCSWRACQRSYGSSRGADAIPLGRKLLSIRGVN